MSDRRERRRGDAARRPRGPSAAPRSSGCSSWSTSTRPGPQPPGPSSPAASASASRSPGRSPAGPQVVHRRRDHLGARRLHPGRRAQPGPRAPARARPLDAVHLPQPRGGPLRRDARRGDAPGPDRRGGPHRARSSPTPTTTTPASCSPPYPEEGGAPHDPTHAHRRPDRPRRPVPAGAVAGRVAGRLRAPHPRRRGRPQRRPAVDRATDGGTPRRLTAGPADAAPAWSPDGSRLAFLREGQVHVLAADGGEPEKVTDLPLGAGAPVWSPDGDRIAFTSAVDPADHGPTRTGAAGHEDRRLPGRRCRHVRRDAQPAARGRPRLRRLPPAHRR